MIPLALEHYSQPKSVWRVGIESLLLLLWLLFILGLTLWAVGALYYDLPSFRGPAAAVYALAALCVLIKMRLRSTLPIVLGFLLVGLWWHTLKPSNDRPWQPEVDRTAWAEINGNQVTLHNVRNFDYRSETDFTPVWETRTYDLSQLKGVDLFVNYWGSKFMAHPILSFDFSAGNHLCFSIETRKQMGQSYSAIGGLYRQYELIYIPGDERDLVRVRTNDRKGEDVYLYHLKIPPDRIRLVFLDYLARLNALHEHPEFYNALTSNCTTNIRSQSTKIRPWDWRFLANGYADQMIYERGDLAGDLPFDELKRRALINAAAQAADAAPDFSQRIRDGRPGF